MTQEFNKQQKDNRQSEAISIAVLQNNQLNMDKNISEIKTLVIAFDEKLNCALEKKADKTTVKQIQNDIRWVVYIIIGFVVTGILGVTFIK